MSTDWYRDLHELTSLQSRSYTIDIVAQEDANDDGKQDPESQQAIKPAQATVRRLLGYRLTRRLPLHIDEIALLIVGLRSVSLGMTVERID